MPKRAMLLLLLACAKQSAAPPPAAEPCVERELRQRHLNEFGDAEGTVYPGGTPLFDEKSGKRTDRAEYIFSRHPDIARACSAQPDAGP